MNDQKPQDARHRIAIPYSNSAKQYVSAAARKQIFIDGFPVAFAIVVLMLFVFRPVWAPRIGTFGFILQKFKVAVISFVSFFASAAVILAYAHWKVPSEMRTMIPVDSKSKALLIARAALNSTGFHEICEEDTGEAVFGDKNWSVKFKPKKEGDACFVEIDPSGTARIAF